MNKVFEIETILVCPNKKVFLKWKEEIGNE